MTDLALAPALTPMPASVWVACDFDLCPAFGIQRRVWLPQVAVGVIALPQLVCAACRMHLGFPLYPELEETVVPKIHVGREPTDRADIATQPVPAAAAEPTEVVAVEEVADAAPAETEVVAEAPAAAKKTTPRKSTRAKAGGEG